MQDHPTNPAMTPEESDAQRQADDHAARAHMGQLMHEQIPAEDLATTIRTLEAIASLPLDELRQRIETDSGGNPLYHLGNRRVWSTAQDLTQDASWTATQLQKALAALPHTATAEACTECGGVEAHHWTCTSRPRPESTQDTP